MYELSKEKQEAILKHEGFVYSFDKEDQSIIGEIYCKLTWNIFRPTEIATSCNNKYPYSIQVLYDNKWYEIGLITAELYKEIAPIKKFYIEVTEIYQHTYAVEAEDLDEAVQKVEDAANDGTIDINYEDFISRELEDRTEEVETYDKETQSLYDTLTDEGIMHGSFNDEEV